MATAYKHAESVFEIVPTPEAFGLVPTTSAPELPTTTDAILAEPIIA